MLYYNVRVINAFNAPFKIDGGFSRRTEASKIFGEYQVYTQNNKVEAVSRMSAKTSSEKDKNRTRKKSIFTLGKTAIQELEKLAEELGTSKSQLVDEAIHKLYRQYKKNGYIK